VTSGLEAPSVSVIIPTFNREKVVGDAIVSVLQQTWTDLEVIVVDDASTDNTDDVVRRVGDSRVRYIRHETNRNGAAARNTGMESARGRWIAFLDSDDVWLPHHLDRKIGILEESAAEGVFGSFRIADNGQTTTVRCAPLSDDQSIVDYILGPLPGDVCTPTLVFQAEAIRAVRFDNGLEKHQDWDLVIRFGGRFHLVVDPEPTVIVRPSDPRRMSARMNHVATRRFLDRHAKSASPAALARFYFFLAYKAFSFEGRTSEACGYMAEAWRLRNLLPPTMRLALCSLRVPVIDRLALECLRGMARLRRIVAR